MDLCNSWLRLGEEGWLLSAELTTVCR